MLHVLTYGLGVAYLSIGVGGLLIGTIMLVSVMSGAEVKGPGDENVTYLFIGLLQLGFVWLIFRGIRRFQSLDVQVNDALLRKLSSLSKKHNRNKQ